MARTALVTGGNRGIGLEACRQLAAAGLEIVLTARDADQASAAAGRLGVRSEQLDVADPESVSACAARLAGAGVTVDVLVNNAGSYRARTTPSRPRTSRPACRRSSPRTGPPIRPAGRAARGRCVPRPVRDRGPRPGGAVRRDRPAGRAAARPGRRRRQPDAGWDALRDSEGPAVRALATRWNP